MFYTLRNDIIDQVIAESTFFAILHISNSINIMTRNNFLEFANLLPEIMLLIDPQGLIIAANSAAQQKLFLPADNSKTLDFFSLSTSSKEIIVRFFKTCISSHEFVFADITLRCPANKTIETYTEGCRIPTTAVQKQPLILLRCITKLDTPSRLLELQQHTNEKHLYQTGKEIYELQRLALFDAVTSLPNRHALDQNINHEWKRASRDKVPLSVILIDIDFFKAYNDTHGHIAGDTCLKRIGMAIQAATHRPADFAARYGGEEFAVLLPTTKHEGAVTVAKRIRSAVEQLGITHPASLAAKVVTVSIGVATTLATAHTSSLILLAQADHALYAAKNNGRNCVKLFDQQRLSDALLPNHNKQHTEHKAPSNELG